VQRPRLVTIARRVLGDVDDAEDVVQETWVRWQRTDVRTVTNPPGFLTTAASRLALNSLGSARVRYEVAATPALDVIADACSGPETTAERTEAVEVSMRVLLERLSAAERGAYVLRKGFEYPYPDVAAVLGLSAPNARQLVSRAGTRIHSAGRRPVRLEAHRRLVRAFLTAARTGEFAELEALLAADVRRAA
jgi:RNA polymerase sigma-70 factor (ECF subfamily)